jgi:hypothetical protein
MVWSQGIAVLPDNRGEESNPAAVRLKSENTMKRMRSVIILSLLTVATAGAAPKDRGEAMISLMRLMPADWPFSLVAPDLREFDASLATLWKRLKIDDPPPVLVQEIGKDLGVGDAVDFSQPIGAAKDTADDNAPPTMWVRIPGAAEKVKNLPGARQENDAWQFTGGNGMQWFARIQGDYVVLAPSQELLDRATAKDQRCLADEVKTRVESFARRDAFLHFNVEPLRSAALGGIAQVAPMAPMGAMMLAQQAGVGDPAGFMGGLMAVVDLSRRFMEQIAYVEVSLALDEEAVHATVATGYNDGPIKDYLLKQKPAGDAPLADLEDQPYIMATGYHLPGHDSAFVDYIFEQIKKGMSGAPGADAQAASLTDQLKVVRELCGKAEGVNALFSLSRQGVKVSGDYVGSDPKAILELVRKLMSAGAITGGPVYESTGTKKIGDVEVEGFSMKLEKGVTPTPQFHPEAKVDWPAPFKFFLGVIGNRVRVFMGEDKELENAFRGKAVKPLAAAPAVRDSLAKLPSNRNGVVLLNLQSLMNFVQSISGGSSVTEPAGAAVPPAAVSVSLAGHPARLDVYVPIKAVEPLLEAAKAADGKTSP